MISFCGQSISYDYPIANNFRYLHSSSIRNEDIKHFVKGTIAESSPIIPISAQHNININVIVRAIEENIKTPKRDETLKPLFYVARSFDVNKPGSKIDNLIGKRLAGCIMLTAKQALLGKKVIGKYRKQISEELYNKIFEGINLEV